MPLAAASILVPDSLSSPEQGRYFLNRFVTAFPRHIPERCGDVEPLENVFDEGDLDHTLQQWGTWGFLADRRTPPWSLIMVGAYVNVTHSPHRRLSIDLELEEPTDANVRALRDFVHDVSNAFGAVYAAAHISPKPLKISRGCVANPQEHASIFRMSKWSHTGRLRKFIMNLSWLTIFGPPYVELFGRDRILAAPACQVQSLPYGGIGVQLTPRIDDTEESNRDFETTRGLVQQHLDSNAFYYKSLPQDHVYNAPDFGIPKDWPDGRRAWREKGMAELAAGKGPAYDALMNAFRPSRRPTKS